MAKPLKSPCDVILEALAKGLSYQQTADLIHKNGYSRKRARALVVQWLVRDTKKEWARIFFRS